MGTLAEHRAKPWTRRQKLLKAIRMDVLVRKPPAPTLPRVLWLERPWPEGFFDPIHKREQEEVAAMVTSEV